MEFELFTILFVLGVFFLTVLQIPKLLNYLDRKRAEKRYLKAIDAIIESSDGSGGTFLSDSEIKANKETILQILGACYNAEEGKKMILDYFGKKIPEHKLATLIFEARREIMKKKLLEEKKNLE